MPPIAGIDQSWASASRQGGHARLQEGAEAPWLARGEHHRRSAQLSRSDERAEQCQAAGGRTLGQQPSRELTLTVPTTRAADAEVQADEEPSKVGFRPRQRPQTISASNAISSTAAPTRTNVPPRCLSGRSSQA